MSDEQHVIRVIVDATGSKVELSNLEAAFTKAGATVDRSMESSIKAVQRLQGSVDPVFAATIKRQTEVEKAFQQTALAVSRGQLSIEAASKLVGQVDAKYAALAQSAQKAADSHTVLGKAMQPVSAQLVALSAGAGPVGTFLSSLGPAGLAAAVGIGAAEKSIGAMLTASHELAQKAIELRAFSEATGLSTQSVQALRSESSKFALTSEEIQGAIQHFTANFEELRLGQGTLLTQIRRVNPALADQMQMATSAAEAMTLFGKAVKQTDDIFERNALVKAGAGRGGISTAAFFSNLDVGQVTAAYGNQGLDKATIERLAVLEVEIRKSTGKLKDNIASIFAQPTLEMEQQFLKELRNISEVAKNMDFSKLTSAIPLFGPLIQLLKNFKPPQAKGDTFDSRFSASDGSLKPYQPTPPLGKTIEAQAEDAKRLTTILGGLATVEDIVKARETELAVIRKNNPEITDKQAAALLALTKAQADGTLAMKATADGYRTEQAVLGMNVGDTTAYRLVVDKLNEAKRNGQKVSDETVAGWRREADAAGAAAQAAAKAAVYADMKSQRASVFMTDEDVQIAQNLKGIYGNDIPAALGSSEAAFMRTTNQMKQAKDAPESFSTSLFTDNPKETKNTGSVIKLPVQRRTTETNSVVTFKRAA